MPARPVKKIPTQPLDETQIKKLEVYLQQELKDCFRDREGLEKKMEDWLKQIDGRLERSDRPAAWQSKIDINTSRKLIQAVTARLTNPFFTQPQIMGTKPRKPNFD
jgi:hypothetical protein